MCDVNASTTCPLRPSSVLCEVAVEALRSYMIADYATRLPPLAVMFTALFYHSAWYSCKTWHPFS